MEMWTTHTRMFICFILIFAILVGGLRGNKEEMEEIEEIDNNTGPLSPEIIIKNLDKISRKDLIRIYELISIILSEQKPANESGIISHLGSSGTEIDRKYGSCPPCPLCPDLEHQFIFYHRSRRSTDTKVLETRNKKPSKQCKKFKKKCFKVCKTTKICKKNKKCKKCCENCKDCYQNFNLSNREGKIISSPGFTENRNYSNNLNCKWTFTAPHGEKVSMTILDINTEYGYDLIHVLDGISEEDDKLPILATMSGDEKLEAVISSSSQMMVTFTSDVNVNMTGFQANIIALKKADLPQFEWIDLFTLNIRYATGENETISLTRGAVGENICIFEGATSETSVIITSPSSTNECKSLDQFIEIMVRSKYMGDKKRIFTLRNGQLQQIDINVFGNNELVRKNDTQLNKTNVERKIPTKIRIPIQFGFDQTLVNKFRKYEHDKLYIQKRLLEIFNGVKLNLKNILHETDVEFTLEKRMIYINKELKVNNKTLMESRQYQLREDIPLVIFCAEDHDSNIKGLSFRSGACRKDKERFGVIMITWRDDGSLAADVLEHELGHLIGGVHSQKNGTETHVGHTDFNSENINTWFTLAGERCYGKNCSSPPDIPHGSWSCDTELHSCDLNCDWGFSTLSSTIQCQNGNWSQNIHDMACTPSVFLVAGGWNAERDVKMFHPEVENLNCANKPPALTREWKYHTTFTNRGTLYLCGGHYTRGLCISYSGGNTWSTHYLQQHRRYGHSSVVMGQAIFLIGGENEFEYPGVEQSRLPLLTDTPTWSPVPNMPYKGKWQCSVKVDSNSFVVTGGEKDGYLNTVNTVSKYNVVEETTEALAPLIHARRRHGCLVLQENGTTWIIVTGGVNGTTLNSTEILNLSDSSNVWRNISDLNVARRGHGMALTVKGPIVVAGWNGKNVLKSIEVLNWQTKLWTQFEQSLTTARSYYGGVIEIPSHVFNCELNVETGCPYIPPKENGIWSCDSTNTSCLLICDPGFSSSYTITTCTGGLWKEINKMECTESVYILAGGEGARRNVEIFHPEVPNIKCSSPLPSMVLDWYEHTSFTHQGTIYLCGGWETEGSCITYSNNDNTWSMHSLQEHRYLGHSSVVLGDLILLIGGFDPYSEVKQSRLPFLTETPTWSPVPNMPYKGAWQCSVKTEVNSFVVTGGYMDGYLSNVTRYNIEDETTETLAPLIQPRSQHGCLVKQENGETWIIVTGGWKIGGYLKSTEILNLSDRSNVWISIGDLNVARKDHGMALTVKGPMVVAGRDKNGNDLKSIELLNWQTKTWRQFEQSLTTARYRFGGIIELPGHLFGCETQPIKITGCSGEYQYNMKFTGSKPASVNQHQTCHSVCQKKRKCLGWTWNTNKNKCRIITAKSSLDTLRAKNGSISGFKNACKPKCYLVLSDDDSASTNTQFCNSTDTQNLETDCLNMIHLEPDDFQPEDNGRIVICHHHQDYCENVDYEKVDLLCNPDPGIVTLSTFQRINKHRYYGHLKPYFGNWGK